MATYVLCPPIKFGFDGTTDYTVNFYDSGGLTPASTWSDAGTTLNSATITLDSNNTAQVYLLAGKAYRAIYKNSGGTTVHDVDPILIADPSGNVGVAGTDLTLSGDLFVGDDATITGDLAVSGAVTITGALTVTGNTISNGIMLSSVSPGFRNGTIAASAGSNAITITYVDAAGATPSSTDPVSVSHRSATITSGVMTTRNQTGALSVVIPSGATLGCASSEAVRIHVGLILNAGSAMELAVWTAAVGTSGSIKRYDPGELVSSTAIGTGSDSAQTIYSTTARTSQPMIYVGYIEATSGATAGQWSSIDKIVNWEPGIPMPGDIVGFSFDYDGEYATGTTAMTLSDSIPQNTAGTQFMSVAHTAKSVMNWIDVEHTGYYTDTDNTITFGLVALFKDSVANALASGFQSSEYGAGGAAIGYTLNVRYTARVGSSSAVTYKVRAGIENTSQFNFNGSGSARLMGGTAASRLMVYERHA